MAQTTKNDVVIVNKLEAADWSPQLPEHIPLDRFKAVCQTALNHNPELYKCNARTVLNAFGLAAQDGLMPDGREAALVIFKDRDRGPIAQYMPMIGGIFKRLRQSGKVKKISARVVHENDFFEIQYGDDERIVHTPAVQDPGNPIGAYAIAWLDDGLRDHEWMDIGAIEVVRSKSRAKKGGPWFDFWDEMARKTVIRRLSKRLPLSNEDQQFMSRDDDFYDLDRGNSMRDVTPETAPPRPTRAKAKLPAPEPDEPKPKAKQQRKAQREPTPGDDPMMPADELETPDPEPADDPWTVTLGTGEVVECDGPGDAGTKLLDELQSEEHEGEGDITDLVAQNAQTLDRIYEENEALYGKIQHTIATVQQMAQRQ